MLCCSNSRIGDHSGNLSEPEHPRKEAFQGHPLLNEDVDFVNDDQPEHVISSLRLRGQHNCELGVVSQVQVLQGHY